MQSIEIEDFFLFFGISAGFPLYFFKVVNIWPFCRHTIVFTVTEHESFVVEIVEVFKLRRRHLEI